MDVLTILDDLPHEFIYTVVTNSGNIIH